MEQSDLRRVKDGDRMVTPWNLKVEDVEDGDVDGPDGKEVGEVEEVLEDTNGEIRAVVLEYGGFLGLTAARSTSHTAGSGSWSTSSMKPLLGAVSG